MPILFNNGPKAVAAAAFAEPILAEPIPYAEGNRVARPLPGNIAVHLG